ncbi:MAG: DUF1573 domain-containing protein [Acidobacteria bacterium]|nr:DUF1573 domain-containing protein [Acidobacteriota bacterium]
MKLKPINLIAVLIFASALSLSAFAQDKPAADKVAPKDVPKLFVDDTKHEFGKVKEGDEVKHVFKIKNEGKAELIIYNVSPACGCTASDFTKSLAPGAEGTITLSVKTAGMNGWTERYAEIISNDKSQPDLKLWMKMDVQKADAQAGKN